MQRGNTRGNEARKMGALDTILSMNPLTTALIFAVLAVVALVWTVVTWANWPKGDRQHRTERTVTQQRNTPTHDEEDNGRTL